MPAITITDDMINERLQRVANRQVVFASKKRVAEVILRRALEEDEGALIQWLTDDDGERK